jgi:trehalose synthase
VILSCEEFIQEMKPPHRVIMPAINPFNIKNRELSDKEIDERLAHYDIPTDLPVIGQISRFDPWKDPQAAVEVFKLASKEVDARLVLLGNFATDG